VAKKSTTGALDSGSNTGQLCVLQIYVSSLVLTY